MNTVNLPEIFITSEGIKCCKRCGIALSSIKICYHIHGCLYKAIKKQKRRRKLNKENPTQKPKRSNYYEHLGFTNPLSDNSISHNFPSSTLWCLVLHPGGTPVTKNIDWNKQHKTAKAQSAGTISKYQARKNTSYKLTTEQPELDAKGKKRLAEILAQYPMIIE